MGSSLRHTLRQLAASLLFSSSMMAFASEPPAMQHYVIFLNPVRDTFLKDGTPEEWAKVGEHFQRLKQLRDEGTVLLAGPSLEPPNTGIVILEAADEAEAKAVMDGDPAIVAGVFKGTISPFELSLFRDSKAAIPKVNTTERILKVETIIDVPAALIWNKWTTNEGIQSFLAPKSNVDCRVGGPFEVIFSPDAPVGSGGNEGSKILALVPGELLVFEWNAPPSFPKARQEKKTTVVLQLQALDARTTRVTISEMGWGTGGEWDGVYQYFEKAWPKVLEWCKAECEKKPEKKQVSQDAAEGTEDGQ